jgi:hypothetical protein
LSGLLKEVQLLLGFKKVNTSAYHPQTDGLVERFNRTLTAMLAKTVERGGRDWDQRLPFVLFAYRASQQPSTLESPFFLLYGKDPRLPTDTALYPEKTRRVVDLKAYGAELADRMWDLARQCFRKAQKKKDYYDKKVRPPNFRVGDRVFLFKPADKTGPTRKFARPYHGPFRVVDMDVNTARIRRVDRPNEDTVQVAVDRLRHCPSEVPDTFWPPPRPKRKKGEGGANLLQTEDKVPNETSTQVQNPGKGTPLDERPESSMQSTQGADSGEPEEEGELLGPQRRESNGSTRRVSRDSGPVCQKGDGPQEQEDSQDTTINLKWRSSHESLAIRPDATYL